MHVSALQKHCKIKNQILQDVSHKILDWYLERTEILENAEISRQKIKKNLERFLPNYADYINNLPDHKKRSLEAEIENLKLHIQKGSCLCLPPGGGTENNVKLHHYLNRDYLRGTALLGMELADAVLSVLFLFIISVSNWI